MNRNLKNEFELFEEESSTTFTEKLEKQYRYVCNENKKQTKIYYCASSNKIIPRSLDLSSDYVFCNIEHNDKKGKSNEILEYKLAAFLIKKALENENWFLPIQGKEWSLLDVERTFTKKDLSDKGKGKRLDILAYEEKTNSYIVLELKIDRAFAKANKELECYTNTIKKWIISANRVYDVTANNVKGYIVWNSPKEKSKEIDSQWGIIEYEVDILKNDVSNLEFSIVNEYSNEK